MAWLTEDGEIESHRQLTPDEERRRRSRSLAIALVLGGLVIIMIAITLVKGPAALVQPL